MAGLGLVLEVPIKSRSLVADGERTGWELVAGGGAVGVGGDAECGFALEVVPVGGRGSANCRQVGQAVRVADRCLVRGTSLGE